MCPWRTIQIMLYLWNTHYFIVSKSLLLFSDSTSHAEDRHSVEKSGIRSVDVAVRALTYKWPWIAGALTVNGSWRLIEVELYLVEGNPIWNLKFFHWIKHRISTKCPPQLHRHDAILLPKFSTIFRTNVVLSSNCTSNVSFWLWNHTCFVDISTFLRIAPQKSLKVLDRETSMANWWHHSKRNQEIWFEVMWVFHVLCDVSSKLKLLVSLKKKSLPLTL